MRSGCILQHLQFESMPVDHGRRTQRQQHIKDAIDFFSAVQDGSLPAVSFLKPGRAFWTAIPASSAQPLRSDAEKIWMPLTRIEAEAETRSSSL